MGLGQILFSFSGRINRGKWWLAVVLWAVFWVVATILIFLFVLRDVLAVGDLSAMSGEQAGRLLLSGGIWVLVFVVLALVATVSGLAIGVKRLHDRDKSGWWILVFYFGPGVLSAIAGMFDDSPVSIVLNIGGLVIAIWALVELGFLRGTQGSNAYGPNPLAQPA